MKYAYNSIAASRWFLSLLERCHAQVRTSVAAFMPAAILGLLAWAQPVCAATIIGVPMSAAAVSGDGSVVVGSGGGRWTETGGMSNIGLIPGFGPTYNQGVSLNGTYVVGHGGNAPTQAFIWTVNDGFTPLASPGGYNGAFASGVSSDGSTIVGWAENGAKRQAVWWTNGNQLALLGYLLNATYSMAHGVSADGSVVVGISTINGTAGYQAVRWVNGGPATGLGFAAGDVSSFAYGISADGAVIVGTTAGTGHSSAFRWTADQGMVALTSKFGFQSDALAANNDGSIIVGRFNPGPQSTAFIWDAANNMRDLKSVLTSEYGMGSQLANWTLSVATSISADGTTIAGYGYHDFRQEGWIIRIPEPSSHILVFAGLLSCAAFVRSSVQRKMRHRMNHLRRDA